MRKLIIIVFMMCCSIAFLKAMQCSSSSDENIGAERTCKIIEAKTPQIRRSPGIAHYDVIIIYDETEINVYFCADLGLANYWLNNIDTGEIVSGIIDTSSTILTIPMYVLSPNSISFYIEFEDGSWCNVNF